MNPGVQEWIHKLEVGEGRRWLALLLCALASVALSGIYLLTESRNLSFPEAMDAAQVARNLSRGEGFTTQFLRPASTTLVLQHRGEAQGLTLPHPDLANPPLYPLILSMPLRVVKVPDELPRGRHGPDLVVAATNTLLFLALLGAVYGCGRTLFDPLVGVLSVVALAGSEVMWQFSASGLPAILLMLGVVLLVWCLAAVDQGIQTGTHGNAWLRNMAFLTGMLAGGCGLTRYPALALVLPTLAYLFFGLPAGRRALGWFALGGFALVVVPWLIRNWTVSGTVLGLGDLWLYRDTRSLPGDLLDRSLGLSREPIAMQELWMRLLPGLSSILQNDLPRLAGTWLTLFFLPGLMVRFLHAPRSRIRWFTLGTLVVLGFLQAAIERPGGDFVRPNNLVAAVGPLVVLFGAAFFTQLMDQIDWGADVRLGRGFVLGLFSIAAVLPYILAVLPPKPNPRVSPPYHPPLVRQLATWLEPEEIVMTDIPWGVAWYGDRTAVWLTHAVESREGKEDFLEFDLTRKKVSAVYLTGVTMNQPFLTGVFQATRAEAGKASGNEALEESESAVDSLEWGNLAMNALVKRNLPSGFPLQKSPSIGYAVRGHLILFDWERWGRKPRE